MSSDARGRGHRHGARKGLVEGIGGLLTGAALVLFIRGLVKGRSPAAATARQQTSATQAAKGDSA